MVKIAHLADLQIRNHERHKEFQDSFEHLFRSLKGTQVDLIVVAGDVFHHKSSMSPEAIRLGSNLFSSLGDIAPTIIIPGNHDLVMTNKARLDLITPIIEAIKHPNIIYLFDSQVFSFEGTNFPDPLKKLEFAIFSCIDDNWPPKEELNQEKIKIGLYHGMVDGAVLQNGQVVENCPHSLNNFLNTVNFLMMGDIHKTQIFNGNRAAYPGSYPQQNFGESTDKGYLLWNIESKNKWEVDFIKLPNVCPFYTIEISDSLDIGGCLDLQSQARIRVLSRQLAPYEEQEIRKKIQKLYNPREIYFKDKESAHLQEVKISKDIKVEDIADISIQEKLIKEFLSKSEVLCDFDTIYELNRKYEQLARQDEDITRNVQYKYRKMWWSNLFSYGENNEIDFRKYFGVLGILGKNKTGKSSAAIDIPLYIKFNTNSKSVVKNDELINENKDYASGGLELEIGSNICRIERQTIKKIIGKRKGKAAVQGETEVAFKIFDKDGKELEDKGGSQRTDTDKQIRKIFGTAEDFMSTSVTPQWKLLKFIEKKNTDRLKTLGRYFDVDIFQKKYELANKDIKDVKAELKFFEKQNLKDLRDELYEKLNNSKKNRDSLKEEGTQLDRHIKTNSLDIEELSSQVASLTFESEDESSLRERLIQTKRDGDNKKKELEIISEKQKRCINEHADLTKAIESFNVKEVEEKYDAWIKEVRDDKVVQKEIILCNVKISEIDKSLENLKDYTCIRNPDCCMLKEIERISKERQDMQSKLDTLKTKQDQYNTIFTEKINPLSQTLQKHYDNVDFSLSRRREIESNDRIISSLCELIQKIEKEVCNLTDRLEQQRKNKQQIIKNLEIEGRISVLKNENTLLHNKRKDLQARINRCDVDINLLEDKIDTAEKHINQHEDLKIQYSSYEHYLSAVGKQGIPKLIVHNNLDLINRQIKKILSGCTNFDVEIESTGKEIEIFFTEGNKKRIIELCSGMEKTIAALVLRAAMVSITTLPRSNIFVLDEIFGALDEEYVESMKKILNNLTNLFDCVIIITHIDDFKDVVDHIIEVSVDQDGYSRLA